MAVMGETYTEAEEGMEQMGEAHPLVAEAAAVAYLDQADLDRLAAAVEGGYSDVAEEGTLLDQM